jgi:hypothetical protein
MFHFYLQNGLEYGENYFLLSLSFYEKLRENIHAKNSTLRASFRDRPGESTTRGLVEGVY